MAVSGDLSIRERLINLAGSLYLLAQKKTNSPRRSGVIIVNYHQISGPSFRRHLDYLRRHYQILSPQAFLDWLDDKSMIDRPSVVFTFDDGYLSFYKEIYPILVATETPVLVFVSTGFVGKKRYFWADELRVGLEKASNEAIIVDDKWFYLYPRLYRSDFYGRLLKYLCSLDEESRIGACKQIFSQLDVDSPDDDMKAYRFLNWEQILEMDKSGLVAFGSHTVNHPNLTSLSCDGVRFEVRESKRILEDCLGKGVLAFAYPYGGREFFDNRIISELQRAGYACAFTTIQGGTGNRKENSFRLKRVMLFDYQNRGALALKLDRFSGSSRCGICPGLAMDRGDKSLR